MSWKSYTSKNGLKPTSKSGGEASLNLRLIKVDLGITRVRVLIAPQFDVTTSFMTSSSSSSMTGTFPSSSRSSSRFLARLGFFFWVPFSSSAFLFSDEWNWPRCVFKFSGTRKLAGQWGHLKDSGCGIVAAQKPISFEKTAAWIANEWFGQVLNVFDVTKMLFVFEYL